MLQYRSLKFEQKLDTDHASAFKEFFIAYGHEQAVMAEQLSAQAELERKGRVVCSLLHNHFESLDDIPPQKLVVDSPYGMMLLFLDDSRTAVKRIELIEYFNITQSEPNCDHSTKGSGT